MYGNAGTYTATGNLVAIAGSIERKRAQFRKSDHASKVSRKFSREKTLDAKRKKPKETVVKDRYGKGEQRKSKTKGEMRTLVPKNWREFTIVNGKH